MWEPSLTLLKRSSGRRAGVLSMTDMIYSNVLSDYAIKYFNAHDSIAPAGEFRLTDEEYEDFVKFASKKEFDVRTEAQIEMEGVLDVAEQEGLCDNLEGLSEEMEAAFP